jgi:hypothetical protein
LRERAERVVRRMNGLARHKESELYSLDGGEGEEGSRGGKRRLERVLAMRSTVINGSQIK